jgi:hypothetical protein
MKQIGARQEAGRIGGIGPCGRELCCATWMTSFVSVSTSAARYQDISLNPQKLAGQCAKLKCCLNYEIDCYVEAQKRLPSREIELETKDGTFYFFKADILTNQITYSTDKAIAANLVTITGRRAFEVIGLNKRGIKPDTLLPDEHRQSSAKSADLLEQDSLTRFDRRKKRGGKGNGGNANNGGNNAKNNAKANENAGNENGGNNGNGNNGNGSNGNEDRNRRKKQRNGNQEPRNNNRQRNNNDGEKRERRSKENRQRNDERKAENKETKPKTNNEETPKE